MSNFVEIRPRDLRPALLELDGISRTSIEAHYRLYQGYVAKRNEILGRLADVDRSAANQVYSDLRSLKVDLTFAAADAFASNVLPIIQQIEASGASSYRGIADVLNARGVRTARGGEWHATTVRNLMLRAS